MNITLITQFYPPEVGAAAIRLSRLARLLVAAGHTVTVVTGLPNYPTGIVPPEYRNGQRQREIIDGVQIVRVWVYATPSKSNRARLLNQLSFMVSAAWAGLFIRRADVLLVESHPLFVSIIGGWLSLAQRMPLVLNVSDLWPESAVATGALRADSLMVKIASRVEHWAYHRAAHLIALTQGVRDGILQVRPEPARVTLIQNAVDLVQFHPPTPAERAAARALRRLDDRFVVVHVGNISLTYDFEIIMRSVEALPEMTFIFAGSGSQAPFVEKYILEHALKNVIMTGVLPHTEMPSIWAAADACLIALRDHSVAGGTLPAKMYEAMATGTPVIAAIRGEGAAMLTASGAGVVVPIGDSSAMTAALQALAEDESARRSYAQAGRAYAELHLTPEQVAFDYAKILEGV